MFFNNGKVYWLYLILMSQLIVFYSKKFNWQKVFLQENETIHMFRNITVNIFVCMQSMNFFRATLVSTSPTGNVMVTSNLDQMIDDTLRHMGMWRSNGSLFSQEIPKHGSHFVQKYP